MQNHQLQSVVDANRHRFERMVDHAITAQPTERRIMLCAQSMMYAVHNPCGLYNSQKLEECLTAIAATHTRPLSTDFNKGHVLHVMSRAYRSGGHTRVVERWLNAAPPEETHDVVLLSQGDRPLPASLHNRALRLDDAFPLEKALNLRELASRYEYIVLHSHMHDPVPTLAFGTPEFKRPVLLYNHADHLPWLGCSVIDLAINLRSTTVPINETGRGIANTTVLPLPVDQPPLTLADKATAKKALGLPPRSKVIISIASAYKFKPMKGIDFIDTLEKILQQEPDAVALIIGPSPSQPEWHAAIQRNAGRIHVLGILPYSEIGTYLAAADIALDSFPLGSTTSLMDIARYNIPCLALDTATNGYDAFTKAGIAFPTTAEIVTHALKSLASPSPNKLFTILKEESFPESFRKKLRHLSSIVPSTHHVHKVQQGSNKLTPFSTLIASNILNGQHSLKSRLKHLTRYMVYVYVKYLYPLGLTKKIYRKLDSYSIL